MLALWEYFWDWDGATPPQPPPEVVQDAGAGSGRYREKRTRRYQNASDEFWDVRERYLRRYVEPVVNAVPASAPAPVPAEQQLIEPPPPGREVLLEQARAAALQRARAANNALELMQAAARVRMLTLDIQKERQQNYARAIAILLLDAF